MTLEPQRGDLDLSRIVRPGDSVLWSQGASEPLALTEALVAQRAAIGRASVFVGLSLSSTLRPEHADHLSVTSYGGLGTNAALARAGVLGILPSHYSQLPSLLESGALRCDVALVQLSAPNAAGEHSLGASNDYMLYAARRARVVVAEINERAPWTYGSELLAGTRIDYAVRTSRPLPELKGRSPGEIERRIAQGAAAYVPDGAVLQTGVGVLPDAILSALRGHRDLGVHSGVMTERLAELMEAGVVTNRLKPIDRGVAVAGILLGGERLYRFAHENRELRLCPAGYTHDPRVLSRLERFVAINSALEVDLTGQVNAELGDGTYLGAVGGQLDFVRAATGTARGRSIIALPSTARGNAVSRIVARLSEGVTTTPRSDADVVVTEWGSAELRGRTLEERARGMIAIAHPDFREPLEREAHDLFRRAAPRASQGRTPPEVQPARAEPRRTTQP